MTIRGLVWLNICWNSLFVLMAASEISGATAVHGALPWYLKWWWITALAGGNLLIHVLMLARIRDVS
jgi:hypothetical protein